MTRCASNLPIPARQGADRDPKQVGALVAAPHRIREQRQREAQGMPEARRTRPAPGGSRVGSAAASRMKTAPRGTLRHRLSIAAVLCSACNGSNCGGVCDVTPSSRIIAMIELKSAAVCTSAIGFASKFTARPLTTSESARQLTRRERISCPRSCPRCRIEQHDHARLVLRQRQRSPAPTAEGQQ